MNAEETIKIPMKVIRPPKKGTRAILQSGDTSKEFIFIVGDGGNIDYVCGHCGNIICKNVFEGQIKNIVFKCPKCNHYNEIS